MISDFTLAASQRFFISSRSSKYFSKSEGIKTSKKHVDLGASVFHGSFREKRGR
jgi:hypothetical protein